MTERKGSGDGKESLRITKKTAWEYRKNGSEDKNNSVIKNFLTLKTENSL